MSHTISRRDLLKLASAQALCSVPGAAHAGLRRRNTGWVRGHMTGAEALVETIQQEGTEVVYGIPGAQQNELWDTMKSKHLGYLLVTHEYSAATMADGYARCTGRPGVLCIVPGPGVCNSLTGLGEALLDSIPIVVICGDVANGHHARPFQVHCLDQTALLRPVTKQVITVQCVGDIPTAVRQAYLVAKSGEPGPVGVVIPYNLLIEAARFDSGPLGEPELPWDAEAAHGAFSCLSDRRLRVGIYAGQGCMDYSAALVQVAELLQAPVATSMAGKGCFPENHPLSVGWGYGPQGTRTAENAFRSVDLVLAMGVKFSEVSTGFYSLPQHRHLVHVDINQDNLGRVMRTSAAVHADAGVFMVHLLEEGDALRRLPDNRLVECIRHNKAEECRLNCHSTARDCVDPMTFLMTLRRLTCQDCMAFVDVTVSQYWATEVFNVAQPRTFFNPTNNQGMGWSIPASLGAQRVNHGRQVVTVTGDGCFLMSAMEISTAAREGLPVKFFVLDDHAYHYMQELQKPAYLRTTATILAGLDYHALAQGWNVAYNEITCNAELEAQIRWALEHDGPVLTRVHIDYGRRPIRWIRAARDRYTADLSRDQKARFLARIAHRALDPLPEVND